MRLRVNLPVTPAIKIFFHDHAHRLLFVVAQLDFNLLLHPLCFAVHAEVSLLALAYYIKGRPQLDAHLLVLWRVIDTVFPDELEASVRSIQLRYSDAACG